MENNICYMLIDELTGYIMGISNVNRNLTDKYVTCTSDIYKKAIDTNCNFKIDIEKYNEKILEYSSIEDKDLKNEFIIIDETMIKEIEKNEDLNIARKDKKNICHNLSLLYIKSGVEFEFDNGDIAIKTYNNNDMIELTEVNALISRGMINKEVPINFDLDVKILSIEEFNRLYKELLRNKFFHMIQLKECFKYLDSLKTIEEIEEFNYESGLPIETYENIEQQVSNLLQDGGEL